VRVGKEEKIILKGGEYGKKRKAENGLKWNSINGGKKRGHHEEYVGVVLN